MQPSKLIRSVTIVSLLSGATLLAQNDRTPETAARPAGTTATANTRATSGPISLSTYHAQVLRTRSGDSIGTVRDFLVDPASGRVQYVVVTPSDNAGGRTGDMVVLPWPLIGSGSAQPYVVNADLNTVRGAPQIAPNALNTLNAQAGQRIYQHYGLDINARGANDGGMGGTRAYVRQPAKSIVPVPGEANPNASSVPSATFNQPGATGTGKGTGATGGAEIGTGATGDRARGIGAGGDLAPGTGAGGGTGRGTGVGGTPIGAGPNDNTSPGPGLTPSGRPAVPSNLPDGPRATPTAPNAPTAPAAPVAPSAPAGAPGR